MAVTYTNRTGTTYYLHARKTKTGKPRYVFARAIGDDAIDEIPEGFEITESINGQVNLSKRRPRLISDAEEGAVRSELGRRPKLKRYRVEAKGDALTIYEPLRTEASLRGVAMFTTSARLEQYFAETQFSPVLRFVVDDADKRTFRAERMTYRGDGGWSRSLASGEITKLARKLVPHLGEDTFFDLM